MTTDIPNRTIAIVEDDPDQSANYAEAVRRAGFEPWVHAGRAAAIAAFEQHLPDLAILDIMLADDPDGGFEVCRYLTARAPRLPVIFLTSRGDDIDRISGLRLGAWDYQTKPVSLGFLTERIRSLFRILDARQTADPLLQAGNLTLDPQRFQARWRGQPLELTYTEFNLLAAIVERRESRGASYEDLAAATRQGIVENNTINTHIRHIRAKFKSLDPGFDAIRSVYGYGYRWSDA